MQARKLNEIVLIKLAVYIYIIIYPQEVFTVPCCRNVTRIAGMARSK